MKIPKDGGVDRPRYDAYSKPASTDGVRFSPVDATAEAEQRGRVAQGFLGLLDSSREQTFRVSKPLNVSVMCLGGMGGSGNVARTCAAGLADAGHNVHLFSSREAFYDDERSLSVKLREADVPKTPQEPDASWMKPLAKQLIAHVEADGIDVIDVHYAAGLLGAAIEAKDALAARGKHVKVIATLHGSDVSIWGKNAAHRDAIAEQLTRCDDVTCVSHSLADQAQRVFGLTARPRVVENSIDALRFHPGQWSNIRERIAPHGERIFCHVSNMRQVKRPIDAIDAFAKTRKAGLAAKLLLVGDGPQMEAMYERAVQHGVAEDILCTGPQPADKLAKFVAASDAVLVTSESESFCLAALEAMACGTPVIGTMCGGLEEIMATVDANDGMSSLLAPVGDTDGLARIALDLFSDSDRFERIQGECVRVPLERYPKDTQIRGYLERLEDLRPSGLEISSRPRSHQPHKGVSVLDVQLQNIGKHVKTKRQNST